MSRRTYNAGDVVEHVVTQELWVLACDEIDGKVFPAGWLGHGEAPAELFRPIQPARREVRERMLAATAGQDRRRGLVAARQLAELRGEVLDDEEGRESPHARSIAKAFWFIVICWVIPTAAALLWGSK